MATWQRRFVRLVVRANAARKRLRWRLHLALGGPAPMRVVAYRGYGSAERIHLKGRVVLDKGVVASRREDRLLRNLRNMVKRLTVVPVPGARVRVQALGAREEWVCDDNGFFDGWLVPREPPASDSTWQRAHVELVLPRSRRQGRVRQETQVLVPPGRARFGVISDLDDTVIHTGATRVLTLLRESFLGNAWSRLPFPGVAAFYRALHAGGSGGDANPLLYVSRSPWNLYDLLSEFFQIHAIPIGPVLYLREWGLSEEGLTRAGVTGMKYDLIERMLTLYRDLPFILIGDSGQKDPEIYQALVARHPGRVLAVYIRNVSRRPERPEAIRLLARRVAEQGSTLILADDSDAMAEHAAARGWIAPERLPGIRGERQRDETPAWPRLAGAGKAEGRTVEVAPGEGAQRTVEAVERGAIERAVGQGDPGREGAPTVLVRGED